MSNQSGGKGWSLLVARSDAELPFSDFLFISLQFYVFQVRGFPLKKTYTCPNSATPGCSFLFLV